MQASGISQRRATAAISCPIYPVLMAVNFPLWLLSNNMGLFDASDTFRPILISVLVVICGLLCLNRLYRNRHKAAVVMTIGILCLYSFSLLRSWMPIATPSIGALVLLTCGFLFFLILIFKTRQIGTNTTKILNAFALAFFILPVQKITAAEFDPRTNFHIQATATSPIKTPAAIRPSVIHIVLDGYSRADVLNYLYGYDNSDFLESLRKLGFVIANRATAPYNQTLLSMNAIFAMEYINERLSKLPIKTTAKQLRVALHWGLQNSTVLEAFRSMGYPIIVIEGIYWGVEIENADVVISSTQTGLEISNFETVLLRFTPINKIIQELEVTEQTYTKIKFELKYADFNKFKQPFFVYNHIIAPHPPFNINRYGVFQPSSLGIADGSHRERDPQLRYKNYRTGYLEKLRFTNRAILEKVRRLQKEIPDPKIIVIHGDHGSGLFLDFESEDKTCLKERFATLVAVYSSDDKLTDAISDQINLVNLYRYIFTHAFGWEHPPLPSRNYFATWDNPENLSPISPREISTFGPTCVPAPAVRAATYNR